MVFRGSSSYCFFNLFTVSLLTEHNLAIFATFIPLLSNRPIILPQTSGGIIIFQLLFLMRSKIAPYIIYFNTEMLEIININLKQIFYK